MGEQARSTDLNTPALTGRRRYRATDLRKYHGVSLPPVYVFALEVEESVYTEVSGVKGWEIRWRDARSSDISETIVGLPDQGS